MDQREFLARMDRRMESGDALLGEIRADVRLTREEVRLTREQVELSREEAKRSRGEVRASREQRERSDQVLERNAEALERNAEVHSDLRGFIREMINWMDRSLREQRAETRAHTLELQRFGARMEAELRDLREESRAQRSALLRLFDRLDGPERGGSSAPA